MRRVRLEMGKGKLMLRDDDGGGSLHSPSLPFDHSFTQPEQITHALLPLLLLLL